MGQSAIIFFVAAFLAGSLLLVSMQHDTMDADEDLQEHQYKLIARDAAVTGLNLAVRKLAEDDEMGSWTSGSDYSIDRTSYDGNAFSVEVTPGDPEGGVSGDTVDVVARGFAGDARHAIFARYARDEDDKGIPPAFQNAIASDFYFQLQGNVGLFAIEDSINVSIHTNDDLTIKGNSFLVEGYGTYTGEVNISSAAEENFIPNVDYNEEEPNHFWADSVKIPQIDIEKLRETAAESGTIVNTGGLPFTIDGDDTGVIDFTDPSNPFWSSHSYNCSGSCGTAESPFVMVVEGELELLNTVQVKGYGTIVAANDITIDPMGSGGGVYGNLNAKNETEVLLSTLGDIDVQGNACFGLGPSETLGNDGSTYNNNNCSENPIDGSPIDDHVSGITLYAEGLVDFGGTPYIVGGVVAKEATFDGAGTPMITYASAAEETLDDGFENIIPLGPILIAYSEW